jgi:hypothetical protein
MRIVLPKLWHVVVTEENQNILEKWRGVKLRINQITGVCNMRGEKGHNSYGDIKNRSYNFGKEIKFEEFKVLVLKEQSTEPIYEIY